MIIATVNAKRLTDLIRRFPEQTKGDMDKFLEKNARTLISSSGKVPGLVQVTPPFSQGVGGTAAKKQGEASVSRDIKRVYATPGMVYAAIKKAKPALAGVFWALVSKKQFAAAESIAKRVPGIPSHLLNFRSFDDGAEHLKRRSRDGRVNSKRQSFVITDPSATLKRYIKKRQKNVGLLAASIPSAAGSKFGKLNGVPAWVSRHRSRYGYVRDTKGRNKRTITIGITGKAVKDMQRRFSYVVKYRLAAMERELPYVARAIERKLASQIERA